MSKLVAATLALIVSLTVPALAHAAPAGKFLQDAIQGDNGEVANGTLAERNGGSAGVRHFGAMLVRDHSAAKVQAVAAARRDDVPVPAGMAPEAAALHTRLLHLRGREFNRVFVPAMVEDHRKDIAKFEDQARSGDPLTRRLAADTLPTLRKHLHTAEALR